MKSWMNTSKIFLKGNITRFFRLKRSISISVVATLSLSELIWKRLPYINHGKTETAFRWQDLNVDKALLILNNPTWQLSYSYSVSMDSINIETKKYAHSIVNYHYHIIKNPNKHGASTEMLKGPAIKWNVLIK